MGVECCRQEPVLPAGASSGSPECFDYLGDSKSERKVGSTYSGMSTMERSTWFTSQCEESGDEEFYTKSMLYFYSQLFDPRLFLNCFV